MKFTTPYVTPSTALNLIMHVITPPLVTPGNQYGMVITCSNNSLAFVISFDVKITIEEKKMKALPTAFLTALRTALLVTCHCLFPYLSLCRILLCYNE